MSFAGRDRRCKVAAVVGGDPMEEATVGYILSDLKKRDQIWQLLVMLEGSMCRCQINMLFILAQKIMAWAFVLLQQQGQG